MQNTAVDIKYLNLVSYKLPLYKIVKHNPFRANFRCPFCGDSKKDTRKARGYVFEKNSNLFFTCHNCNVPASFKQLINHADPLVYNDYLREKFKKDYSEEFLSDIKNSEKNEILDGSELFKLPKIENLGIQHTAYKFLKNRSIPISGLYYADQFFSFCNKIDPNTFPKYKIKNKPDESRIIIPFLDEKKKLIAFQGRALGDAKAKYITIVLDKSKPHIFGLNKLDKSKRIYVVEGPFDSLFLDNCIAVAQADLVSAVEDYGFHFSDNIVLIYDNEPRNKQLHKSINKAVLNGWKLVIWPKEILKKDINDMIISKIDVKSIIEDRIYSNLRAKLEFEKWRKT